VAWQLLARARQQLGDLPGMLEAAARAGDVASGKPAALFLRAEAMLQCGQVREGRALLDRIEESAGTDVNAWARLVEFRTHGGQHAAAERAARRAVQLRPGDRALRYALAAALVATGGFEEAERLFDALVAEPPHDGDAGYNRATLRRQTPQRNHVAELESLLEAVGDRDAQIPVCHALAKELDDLGEHARSFACLARGAAARRRRLAYRVEADEQTMARIAARFDAAWLAIAGNGIDADGPVFIVGLPRSGTTLVERMLLQHPQVGSVGEVNELALAVMRTAGRANGREDLVDRAARVDPAKLGAAYWGAIEGYEAGGPKVIDKTPLNFLYLGLIARALPRARIVHLRRHPIASCYAMYRTLFRMGYPFSYDLEDLGRYYVAYERLMRHWRAVLGDRVFDLDYERLVAEPEALLRRLLAHCGLDWHAACLHFERDPSPSATASAAQVREPLYRRSVDAWRRHAQALEPLSAVIAAAGIDVR
jgi:tetratricopeptide (TPR) repeat protein